MFWSTQDVYCNFSYDEPEPETEDLCVRIFLADRWIVLWGGIFTINFLILNFDIVNYSQI